MKRSTYLMIDLMIIYAYLLGGLKFSIDRRNGVARIKTRITIYSAIIDLIMVGAIIYFIVNLHFKPRPSGSPDLVFKFNVFLMLTRATSVLVTQHYTWMNLSRFVKFLNAYRQFSLRFIRRWRAHEKYEKYLDQGIRQRLQYTILADICAYIATVIGLRNLFDTNNDFLVLFIALIPTSINIAATFYYLTILNTNALMIIINDELKRVLATAFILQQNYSRATLGRYGQRLARELDELAEAQNINHVFLSYVNKMFDLQGTFVLLDLYVNNIYVIYLMCLFLSNSELWRGYEVWQVYFVPIFFVIYYMDLKVFMFTILKTVDLMKKTEEILKERYYLGQEMEKFLERSVNLYDIKL